MPLINIKNDAIPDQGLDVTINNVTSELIPDLKDPDHANLKVVLWFDEIKDRILICNKTILERLSEVSGDPKKWLGLTINIKTKLIIVSGKEVIMKYIDYIHNAVDTERKSLVDKILDQLR